MTEPPNTPAGDMKAWNLSPLQAMRYNLRICQLRERQIALIMRRSDRIATFAFKMIFVILFVVLASYVVKWLR